MKDYYAILEINETASKETIEKVHKLLVKKYHPDLQEDSKKEQCEEKMKEINEAYAILTDNNKKQQYDVQLKEYKIQKIMEEIRIKQKANAKVEQERQTKEQVHKNGENIRNNIQVERVNNQEHSVEQQTGQFNVSDEEIRRQAQVYYNELYRQYLYYNGYIKEDFKTVAKRYLAVIITILVVLGTIYALYKIPYFNNMLSDIINSNEILKNMFGGFF